MSFLSNLAECVLAVEICTALYCPALFLFGEFGEHGQGQRFFASTLSLWEIPFAVSEIHETGLQVQRDGIVDLGANLSRSKKLAQLVAAVGADHILMENMVGLRGSLLKLKGPRVFPLTGLGKAGRRGNLHVDHV